MSQTLSYKNGFMRPLRPKNDVGGEPLQYNQLDESELDELISARPNLTYGDPAKPAPVEFVPAHVAFDKKARQKFEILGTFLKSALFFVGADVQCLLQANRA